MIDIFIPLIDTNHMHSKSEENSSTDKKEDERKILSHKIGIHKLL